MTQNVFAQYLEAEVLGADPVKLVNLLYRGAIDAVGAARRHLAQGAIPDRARQVTKAWGILQELSGSLDHARGGELSRNLAELYGYIQTRLIQGNVEQSDAPLAEAEALLNTLAEAWRQMPAATPARPPQSAYVPVECSI